LISVSTPPPVFQRLSWPPPPLLLSTSIPPNTLVVLLLPTVIVLDPPGALFSTRFVDERPGCQSPLIVGLLPLRSNTAELAGLLKTTLPVAAPLGTAPPKVSCNTPREMVVLPT